MKLQLADVTKRYAEVTAVDDLSFSVDEGEFLTLLGPSGSGKTTTLMLIAGFIAPDRGQVYLNDRDVTNLPEFKRNIGVVFQNYALFPHMTVARNIAFPLRMRHVAKAEIDERVTQVLAMVGLASYHTRYPRQLSGGQQQRVALARALVFDPPILLMDEPLGSLDRKLRDQMQVEFKRIQRELNVTVVYVTHDQEEALAMSDRIALMHDGRIVQIGTAGDLYERPANHFVADFVGEANFMEGEVVQRGPRGIAIAIEGERRIRSRADFAAGTRVVVAVRPERITPIRERDGDGGGSENAHPYNELSGILTEEVYTGATVKYTVTLDGKLGTFRIRHQMTGGAGEGQRLGRGDRLILRWLPDDTIVMLADDEKSSDPPSRDGHSVSAPSATARESH